LVHALVGLVAALHVCALSSCYTDGNEVCGSDPCNTEMTDRCLFGMLSTAWLRLEPLLPWPTAPTATPASTATYPKLHTWNACMCMGCSALHGISCP